MNDDATDVDHQHAEHRTADAARVPRGRRDSRPMMPRAAALRERVRLTAYHRHDVESGRRYDHHVRSIRAARNKNLNFMNFVFKFTNFKKQNLALTMKYICKGVRP